MTRGGPAADQNGTVTADNVTPPVEPEVPERRTVTFTSQGALKIERAGRQFRGLEQDVDAWNAEHQVYAPSRSPWDGDPRVQIFRPPEVAALPWFDWEATFHDGVHNLRAGLDNLCFELAHLDDVAPSKPRQIYFPMTKDEKGWQDRAKYLESVPRSLLDRLRECQPWARPDPMNPDPLLLIADIDDGDKHRGQGVKFEVLPWHQELVRPTLPLPEHLAKSLVWPLEEWLTMTVTPPLARGAGSMMPVYALPIVMYGDLIAVLPDAQRWLHNEVVRIVRFLTSGSWPEIEMSRVFPEPTWNRWAPQWLCGMEPS